MNAQHRGFGVVGDLLLDKRREEITRACVDACAMLLVRVGRLEGSPGRCWKRELSFVSYFKNGCGSSFSRFRRPRRWYFFFLNISFGLFVRYHPSTYAVYLSLATRVLFIYCCYHLSRYNAVVCYLLWSVKIFMLVSYSRPTIHILMFGIMFENYSIKLLQL